MNKSSLINTSLRLLAAVLTFLLYSVPLRAAETSTDPMVGHWKWFNSDLKIFRANGTMATLSGDGQAGTWKRLSSGAAPRYKLSWSKGKFIDTVTMRGNEVRGTNQYGLRITGIRIAEPEARAGK